MIVKSGKYGKFLACSDYPNCKYTTAITLGIPCPKCVERVKTEPGTPIGELTQKQSRYRRLFYSCNRWPNCDFALWDKPVQKPCPQCKFPIVTEKTTKKLGFFLKCPQKECGWMEVIDPNPSLQGEGSEEKPAVVA
jgi:DNA topoisomerase-1